MNRTETPWHLSEDGRRAEWTLQDVELERAGLTLERRESLLFARGMLIGSLLGGLFWLSVVAVLYAVFG